MPPRASGPWQAAQFCAKTGAPRLAASASGATPSPRKARVASARAAGAAAPWRADEKVIDVSGDAPDMRSLRPLEEARQAAEARGIVINALAIEGDRPGLRQTYEATVIAGPGAFVMAAESRADFARALRAKLVREIA